MTPKEKAKEIFDKMYGKTPVRDEESLIELDRDRDTAIQCALVAVDEILEECLQLKVAYWEEVKEQIETL